MPALDTRAHVASARRCSRAGCRNPLPPRKPHANFCGPCEQLGFAVPPRRTPRRRAGTSRRATAQRDRSWMPSTARYPVPPSRGRVRLFG